MIILIVMGSCVAFVAFLLGHVAGYSRGRRHAEHKFGYYRPIE